MTDALEQLRNAGPSEQAKTLAHLFRRNRDKLVHQDGLDPDAVVTAMLGMAIELTRASEGDAATIATLYGLIDRIERSDLPDNGMLQ